VTRLLLAALAALALLCLSPVSSIASVAPVASVASVAPVAPVSSIASVASAAPVAPAAALSPVASSASAAEPAPAPPLYSRCGWTYADGVGYQLYADGVAFGPAYGIGDLMGVALTAQLDLLTDGNCSARGYLDLRQALTPAGSRCGYALHEAGYIMFYLDQQPFSTWLPQADSRLLVATSAVLEATSQGACSRYGYTPRQ
jgi:hypothetical protein